MTVATDGSELYHSERDRLATTRYGGSYDAASAAGDIEQHLTGATTEHTELLDDISRERIFNLGYFTWVEQQGVSIEDFVARKQPEFWDELHAMAPALDEAIVEFNARTGV